MDKNELIAFLKENLKLSCSIGYGYSWNDEPPKYLTIELKLGDEVISSEQECIN